MSLNAIALLTVDTLELMKLWGELVECYHGVNGYGGDTAEIYTHRLEKYNPVAHSPHSENFEQSDMCREHRVETYGMARDALIALIGAFCLTYDCEASVDGLLFKDWRQCEAPPFDARVRVQIRRKE